MKSFVFVVSILLLVSFSNFNSKKHQKTLKITSNSELQIKGTSNVKDFSCQFNISNLDQPILVDYKPSKNGLIFEGTKLLLENSGFDCGARGINKDFHSLIKSEKYPGIALTLKQVTPNFQKDLAEAVVEIEIAGVKNLYTMETQFSYDNQWEIYGNLQLNIQDFRLKSPKKLFGLVEVSEEIEIWFRLYIRETSQGMTKLK